MSGPRGERAGHRHPLPLAAGQLARPAVGQAAGLEAHQAERASACAAASAARAARAPAPRSAGRASAGAARPPAARSRCARRSADGIELDDVGAVHQDAAVVGIGQPVEAAEQRGLPRAALADERHALAAAHLERDAVERGDRAVALGDLRAPRGHRTSGIGATYAAPNGETELPAAAGLANYEAGSGDTVTPRTPAARSAPASHRVAPNAGASEPRGNSIGHRRFAREHRGAAAAAGTSAPRIGAASRSCRMVHRPTSTNLAWFGRFHAPHH